MASDSMIHNLFRSLESCIHERLAIIEEVCRSRGSSAMTTDTTGKYDELLNSIQTLESRITALESSVQDAKARSNVSETVHVNRIGKEAAPQMWIEAMKDLEIVLPPPVSPAAATSDEEEVEVVEEEEVEEVEEEVEEVEEEAEEVEEEAEEVEEEAEEEAEEYKEIPFKNKTYYKDSQNNVYSPDENGEIDPDAPVGVWDEQRQRVLFKRTGA